MLYHLIMSAIVILTIGIIIGLIGTIVMWIIKLFARK